ncbi:hypothetical protein CDAR_596831 [Caerostris darwini]|uniref:Uncharacterized protein n=1 Tax=Caerostris darwini TaxID=1538125 RepID=A0AAV4WE45_9ARAC|nr:hypothetical protein CDAR_596831 [Caerostris darwini]
MRISTNYHQLRILPLATSTAVRFSPTTRDSSALLQVATPSLSAAPSTRSPQHTICRPLRIRRSIGIARALPFTTPRRKGHFKSNPPNKSKLFPNQETP